MSNIKIVAAEEVRLGDLLDEICAAGTEFIVTKSGLAVASIVPVEPRRRSLEELRGSVKFIGDVMEPIETEEWTFDEDNLK